MPDMTFAFKQAEFSLGLNRIDRTKLYGSVSKENLDESGDSCSLVTMSSDGMTLIPSGGTAFGYVAADGLWCDKGDLKPTDLEGKPIIPVKSTLKETSQLDTTVTLDEYLNHNIRLIYHLDGDMDPGLAKELESGTIFTFPFSYRGGLAADVAFLLAGADGAFWMAVGNPTNLQFLGFEHAVPEADDDDEDDDEGGLMDFGMM